MLALDTNILLLDAFNLINLGKEHGTIVLPSTVLDEIDSKKSGHSEIAFQAREFGRILSKSTNLGSTTSSDLLITRLAFRDFEVHIIDLTTPPPIEDYDEAIAADRKIIYAVTRYADYCGSPITFMSNDVMCRIRASASGLTTLDLKHVESTDMEFTRYLTVDSELFTDLHNRQIIDIDLDYKPEYYNYVFTDAFSGQVKLATLRNGLIDILGKESEAELRRQDAPPTNSGQLFLSRAIQNPNVDVVVVESLAGSGKTVTAISNAIQLVKKGKYKSIHYIRVSVDDLGDKSEAIGFLSGNDDKVAVYLHPLEDTLQFLVRSNHKDSKLRGAEFEQFIDEKVEKLRRDCSITGMITLGMRGRTFSDTVAIVDEVQNLSAASLQKVLTRFGKNCKVILIGSNRQIDNPYINKYTNGLAVVLNACRQAHADIKLHAVTLTKVLRSPLAEWSERIFSK